MPQDRVKNTQREGLTISYPGTRSPNTKEMKSIGHVLRIRVCCLAGR